MKTYPQGCSPTTRLTNTQAFPFSSLQRNIIAMKSRDPAVPLFKDTGIIGLSSVNTSHTVVAGYLRGGKVKTTRHILLKEPIGIILQCDIIQPFRNALRIAIEEFSNLEGRGISHVSERMVKARLSRGAVDCLDCLLNPSRDNVVVLRVDPGQRNGVDDVGALGSVQRQGPSTFTVVLRGDDEVSAEGLEVTPPWMRRYRRELVPGSILSPLRRSR